LVQEAKEIRKKEKRKKKREKKSFVASRI